MTRTNHNPSRRDFLKKSATAAGALTLGSACASPGPSDRGSWGDAVMAPIPKAATRAPLGPDDPIRMGFIGTGGMGTGHLRSTLRQIESGEANVQIVALADVCKPRLDEAVGWATEGQSGVKVDAYRYYTDLLARDDIHCVLIASPEHWHAKHAVDAIATGKDVYLEKPMTLRLPDAFWIQEVMASNPDMRLQVGTQYLTWEKTAVSRRLIADGTIGKPTCSQTSYCRNSVGGEWLYSVDPQVQPGEMLDWEAWCGPLGPREWDTLVYHRWRRYRDYSTGIIGDLLVHKMTPLVYALDVGWPVRVTASGGHYIDKEMENHDQVNLTIEFEDEHTMMVVGSTCNELGIEDLIRGHKANLFLGARNLDLRPERAFSEEIDPQTITCDNSQEQEKLRLDFFNSVRTREQNISTVDHATKVMVIVDLATRSMWEGPAFDFDPSTRQVTPA